MVRFNLIYNLHIKFCLEKKTILGGIIKDYYGINI